MEDETSEHAGERPLSNLAGLGRWDAILRL